MQQKHDKMVYLVKGRLFHILSSHLKFILELIANDTTFTAMKLSSIYGPNENHISVTPKKLYTHFPTTAKPV